MLARQPNSADRILKIFWETICQIFFFFFAEKTLNAHFEEIITAAYSPPGPSAGPVSVVSELTWNPYCKRPVDARNLQGSQQTAHTILTSRVPPGTYTSLRVSDVSTASCFFRRAPVVPTTTYRLLHLLSSDVITTG